MILTNSSDDVFAFHPKTLLALIGLPNNCSTYIGLKYFGSII